MYFYIGLLVASLMALFMRQTILKWITLKPLIGRKIQLRNSMGPSIPDREDITLAEKLSIFLMSFKPDKFRRLMMYKDWVKVKTDPYLYPDIEHTRVNPKTTILHRIVACRSVLWKGNGMPMFSILPDVYAPLYPSNDLITEPLKVSNGVQIVASGKDPLMNLFSLSSDKEVYEYLKMFFSFREKNRRQIFRQTLEEMRKVVDPSSDYKVLIKVYEQVDSLPFDKFIETIRLCSYCQTWFYFIIIGKEEPSQWVFHSQQRVRFLSLDHLVLSAEEAQAIVRVIRLHDARIRHMKYEKTFVHLDALFKELHNEFD